MSRIGEIVDDLRAEAGKQWALLPATGLTVGEVAAAEAIEGNAALEDDVTVTAGTAFVIDAFITLAARGGGIDTEGRAVRTTINFVSAFGGSLINLFKQGRLAGDGEMVDCTATPTIVSATIMAVSGLAGAVLGNSAGRALIR